MLFVCVLRKLVYWLGKFWPQTEELGSMGCTSTISGAVARCWGGWLFKNTNTATSAEAKTRIIPTRIHVE
jgi:hypothetical protein